jgi:hypothetical protein
MAWGKSLKHNKKPESKREGARGDEEEKKD